MPPAVHESGLGGGHSRREGGVAPVRLHLRRRQAGHVCVDQVKGEGQVGQVRQGMLPQSLGLGLWGMRGRAVGPRWGSRGGSRCSSLGVGGQERQG